MPHGERLTARRTDPRGRLVQPRTRPTRTPGERFIRWALWAAVIAAIAWIIWYFAGLFLYLGIGIVFAYVLKPLVDKFQGIGLGRIPSIVLTAVIVGGGVATLATYLVPFLIVQLTELSQQFSLATLEHLVTSVEAWLNRIVPVPEGTLMVSLNRFAETLVQEDRITATMGSLVVLFTDLFYAILIIPFVTFFFLKDGTQIRHALFRLVPNAYFEITLSSALWTRWRRSSGGIFEDCSCNVRRLRRWPHSCYRSSD